MSLFDFGREAAPRALTFNGLMRAVAASEARAAREVRIEVVHPARLPGFEVRASADVPGDRLYLISFPADAREREDFCAWMRAGCDSTHPSAKAWSKRLCVAKCEGAP